MCLIHKWGIWKQYEIKEPERRLSENWSLAACKEWRQYKRCSKCGKVKDVLINTVVEG